MYATMRYTLNMFRSWAYFLYFQVLSEGRIVEFDAPYMLLQNQESKFSLMLKETGDIQSAQLYSLAKESYLEKQQGNTRTKNGENNLSQRYEQKVEEDYLCDEHLLV